LENNELYHCSGYGVHMYHNQDQGAGGADNNIVRNNYINDNGGTGFLLACPGQNNRFYDNILAGNGLGPSPYRSGLVLGGYCGGAVSANNLVYNNTIYHNVGNCVDVGLSDATSSDNNTIRNNICWQNSTDAVVVNLGNGN